MRRDRACGRPPMHSFCRTPRSCRSAPTSRWPTTGPRNGRDGPAAAIESAAPAARLVVARQEPPALDRCELSTGTGLCQPQDRADRTADLTRSDPRDAVVGGAHDLVAAAAELRRERRGVMVVEHHQCLASGGAPDSDRAVPSGADDALPGAIESRRRDRALMTREDHRRVAVEVPDANRAVGSGAQDASSIGAEGDGVDGLAVSAEAPPAAPGLGVPDRTVPSSEPLASRVPSGLNATSRTTPEWPLSTWRSPPSRFWTTISSRPPATAIRRPAGSIVAANSLTSGAENTTVCRLLVRSQSRAVPSQPALIARRPSAENCGKLALRGPVGP